jgi:hypothetical protein
MLDVLLSELYTYIGGIESAFNNRQHSPYHLSTNPPQWQEEAGAVPLYDSANDFGTPKNTISGISFFRGLFVKLFFQKDQIVKNPAHSFAGKPKHFHLCLLFFEGKARDFALYIDRVELRSRPQEKKMYMTWSKRANVHKRKLKKITLPKAVTLQGLGLLPFAIVMPRL